MPIYRWFWTDEGLFWRRGDIIIKKPRVEGSLYYIHQVGNKDIRSRQSTYVERDAFRRGDAWFWLLRTARRQPK
jgi:hypothetical protein